MARPERLRLGWRVIVAGIVMPAFCVAAVGFMQGGNPVDGFPVFLAPVALFTLIGLSLVVLPLTGWAVPTFRTVAFLSGMILAGGVIALSAGTLLLPLSLLAGVVAAEGVRLNLIGQSGNVAPMLGVSLLGLSPLWTGYELIRHAHHVRARGSQAGSSVNKRYVIAGFLLVLGLVGGLELAHRLWISNRLGHLAADAPPETWIDVMRQLSGDPLCGRVCQYDVCKRLIVAFPSEPSKNAHGTTFVYPEIPPSHASLLAELPRHKAGQDCSMLVPSS